MHNELWKLTTREWECALGTLHRNELCKIERRVFGVVAGIAVEAVSLAEHRAPGYMADKIIARCDLNPALICRIPAQITGGKDLLDIAADDGNYSMHNINEVIWPKVREPFRQRLRLYFSRLAAGDYSALVGCGRGHQHQDRHVRIRDLAACLRYISRLLRDGTAADGVGN